METKFCTTCGRQIEETQKFCTVCGAPAPGGQGAGAGGSPAPPVSAAAAPPPAPPPPAQPVQPAPPPAPPAADMAPTGKYEPISTGGYIGILLLMGLPILGQLLTIVWACGGCRKVNKRNLARATLVFLAIGLVLGVICYFAFGAIWRSAGLGDLFKELGGELGGAGELGDILTQLGELKEIIPAQ